MGPRLGLEVLTAMEKAEVDADDRPVQPMSITGATIFVNPYKDEEAAEKKAAEEARLKVGAPMAASWDCSGTCWPALHLPTAGLAPACRLGAAGRAVSGVRCARSRHTRGPRRECQGLGQAVP